jgi:hypothetical protein
MSSREKAIDISRSINSSDSSFIWFLLSISLSKCQQRSNHLKPLGWNEIRRFNLDRTSSILVLICVLSSATFQTLSKFNHSLPAEESVWKSVLNILHSANTPCKPSTAPQQVAQIEISPPQEQPTSQHSHFQSGSRIRGVEITSVFTVFLACFSTSFQRLRPHPWRLFVLELDFVWSAQMRLQVSRFKENSNL